MAGAGRPDTQAAALSPPGPCPLLPDLGRANARSFWPPFVPGGAPTAAAPEPPRVQADEPRWGRDRDAGRAGRGGRCVAMAAPLPACPAPPRGGASRPCPSPRRPAASGNPGWGRGFHAPPPIARGFREPGRGAGLPGGLPSAGFCSCVRYRLPGSCGRESGATLRGGPGVTSAPPPPAAAPAWRPFGGPLVTPGLPSLPGHSLSSARPHLAWAGRRTWCSLGPWKEGGLWAGAVVLGLSRTSPGARAPGR